MENSFAGAETYHFNNPILIIGAGIAGIATALQAVNRGWQVILIEREVNLGGQLKNINSFFAISEKPIDFLNRKISRLCGNPNIQIKTGTTLTDMEGTIGDFTVYLDTGGKISKKKVGAIVVATGLQSIFCPVKYNLGIKDTILGQMTLEKQLTEGRDFQGKSVSFVVGKTTENFQLPFLAALKNALLLREKGSNVNIFYRNMKVAIDNLEKLYTKARSHGVGFFKFENKLDITSKDNEIIINYQDPFLKGNLPGSLQLRTDIVVLPEELLPAEGAEELGKLLGIRFGQDFLGEDNVHVLPALTAREGIYLVGSCQGPCTVPEIMLEAEAVAGEFSKLLAPQAVIADKTLPIVDSDKCVVCLTCYRCCPHKAISVGHKDSINNLYKSAVLINPLACKGCGICAAECPGKAIQLPDYTDDRILAWLDAMEG